MRGRARAGRATWWSADEGSAGKRVRAKSADPRRSPDHLRSTNRGRAAGCGHVAKVAKAARRPYGAPPRYTRRAATAAPLIRSSPGRRGRLPGKRGERSIFLGSYTMWDAGRHYEEGDDVRA